jgi:cytochrome b561
MQMRNSPAQYGAVSKSFHWMTVVLVILGWTLGYFHDDLPHAFHQLALVIHISIGLTVLVLVVSRLAWRTIDPPPASEKTALGELAEFGARMVHFALYGLLLAIPVFGILVQFARGHALPIFGVFEIASPWVRDREFARAMIGWHGWLANGMMLLVLLHAVAALTHHFVLRDRTLARMLPADGRWRREGLYAAELTVSES